MRTPHATLHPLDRVAAGAVAVVRELRGGSELAARLAPMGLTVGAPLQVLQNRRRGPLLVVVRDTRIALGRGEAAKILVEPAPR
jgi:ferrous iron transport protein A